MSQIARFRSFRAADARLIVTNRESDGRSRCRSGDGGLRSGGSGGTAVISVGVLVVIAVAAALMMFTASAAEAQEIPRRHDGRPDLSGTYDIATLTPAQRPDRFGDRLELTPEEAAALAEHWSTNFDKDHAPSDPDREAPPKGGTGIYAPEFTGAAGKVGGYNAFFVDIGTGAFQLNGKYRTSIITDPPDGRYPPLSEFGQERSKRLAPFRHENTGTAWWLELPVGPYDDHELRPPRRTLHPHARRFRAAVHAGDVQQPEDDRADRHPRDDPDRVDARCADHPARLRASARHDPQVERRLDRLVGRGHPGRRDDELPGDPRLGHAGFARHAV